MLIVRHFARELGDVVQVPAVLHVEHVELHVAELQPGNVEHVEHVELNKQEFAELFIYNK